MNKGAIVKKIDLSFVSGIVSRHEPFSQEELSEIGAVLTSDTCD